MGTVSISYTNELVKDEERAYLRTLPAHIKVEFQLNDQNTNLLLVHGSPRKINEYLFEDREEKSLLRIVKEADATILAFGHTHKPFHRVLYDKPTNNCYHTINTGSVGKPKDGNRAACYVMLEINERFSPTSPEGLAVNFIRVKYDVEKAASAVENSPLPNSYAEMLRKAF